MSIVQTPNIGALGEVVAGNNTPLVFKVSNGIFPQNSGDPILEIEATASGIYTALTYDAPHGYFPNQPLKVTLGDVTGVYRIIRVIDAYAVEINLRFGSLSTTTGTAQKTYTNYQSVLRVYAGLPTNHAKHSIRPMREVVLLRSAPNSDNIATFDISSIVMADISPIKEDFTPFAASPFCLPVLTVFSTNPALLSFTVSDSTNVFFQDELNFSRLFVFGSPNVVTGLFFDDALDPDVNAEVIGTVDLSLLTGLTEFRARNQNLVLLFGDFVKTAGVEIDVTNSIISGLAAMIDRLIIANGGTLNPADTTTFTGTAGITAAGRLLALGTITVDLTDPANQLLVSKIGALEAVGWTITTIITVCNKSLAIDTVDATFAATFLEKSTTQIVEIVFEAGALLLPKLYDTLANAVGGTSTGLLATDITGINGYLLANSAPADDFGIRLEAIDGVTVGNKSLFTYKAFPTATRACGAVQDVLGLRAFASYGLRLITGTYTGKAITLRRVTGGTVADFYFNAAGRLRWLDTDLAPSLGETQSVETWAGASEVRVVTLYDQSGSNFDCTAVTARQPLLDRTVRGIRATAQGQGLFFTIGSVPSWLSTSNVTLTFVANFQTLNGNYGFDPNNVAGLCTIRNNVESNVPMFVSVRNSDLKSFVSINKRPEATNPPAQTILSTDTFPKPSIKTTIFAARDANSLDFYRRNGDLSKNEQFTTALNPLASNGYAGTGYEIVLGNVQVTTSGGASNGNVPVSEIIIYQDKLTAEQVQQVSLFLNAE